jgi:type II secretory pathway pseudopilin PulG
MMSPRAAGATGQSARLGGYTLLEIALVVTIIVLLVGAVVPLSSGFVREQRLREAVRELLVLAKTARTEAMTTGRAAEVVFAKNGFALVRSGDDEPSETVRLARGTTYQLLPLGEDKARRPDGQRWIFQPTGLCEPLTVRIAEGEAWIEVRFDPLTAGIEEESYHIP